MPYPLSERLREAASEKCGLGSDRIVGKDLLEQASMMIDELARALKKSATNLNRIKRQVNEFDEVRDIAAKAEKVARAALAAAEGR